MSPGVHDLRTNFALAALGFLAIASSLLVGPAAIAPADALAALFAIGEDQTLLIIREIRLPRALAAYLVGAALGAAGAALQGLLRNPLADPGVLGVSSAATLAAVIAVYFGLAAAFPLATPFAAMIGAGSATALLYALGAGRVSIDRLILIGVGISSLCGSFTALVMNLAPNPFVLSDLFSWLFGSVANRSLADCLRAAPLLALGAATLAFAARNLSALTLGEETAASLGVNLKRTRGAVIAGSAILVGVSVALAGAVGFVGVVAPHLARPFARHDPARTLVPAALIGGALLAGADLFVRTLPFPQELKLGVAAALVGAPMFIAIAARLERFAR